MQNAYTEIAQKLEAFIKRFYINQLIKGLIYSVALLFTLFIVVNLLEYFGHFTSIARLFLFIGYILSAILVLAGWVINPFLKIKKLGKTITHEQAAQIVGKHFNQIEDKILNVLQLNNQVQAAQDVSLINAAIQQKTIELKPINFSMAINLGENKRYVKYAVLPIIIFILILVIYPNLITQSTTRIINYKKEFKPVAPFSFILKQTILSVQQHDDLNLELKVNGSQLPNEVFINYNGFEYKMQKNKNGEFLYTFNNLQKNTIFNFFAAGFYSDNYTVTVLPKPLITQLQIELNYPEYTQKPNEVLTNTGDITIPTGTWVTWKIKTENIKSLTFDQEVVGKDSVINFTQNTESSFVFKKQILKSTTYALQSVPKNKENTAYTINVINDAYPEITVEE
ncbi:MAG: DUF4175 domain-containing protein, partial [Bacteroidia bacterium]|nr:DUF4175 domain-containing protein [Bacteroidia bacterium]